MKGTLYGVGTGPGDPELLTLKALKIIKESDTIILPASHPRECVSYQTVRRAFTDIQAEELLDKKELICLPFPMIRDQNALKLQHEKNADRIAEILKEGKQASFLTIGDPAIYSTYGYIHKVLQNRGFDTRIISGVPSFCAAAACTGEILCEGEHSLEILPSYSFSAGKNKFSKQNSQIASRDLTDILSASGTKVLMKPARDFSAVKEALNRSGRRACMAVNCGKEDELVYLDLNDFPDDADYFSIIIAKKDERETDKSTEKRGEQI